MDSNTKAHLKREPEDKSRQIAKLDAKLKQMEKLLERHAHELSALNRYTESINRAKNLGELAKTALNSVIELGNQTFGVLCLIDGENGESNLAYNTGISEEQAVSLVGNPLVENMMGRIIEFGQIDTLQNAFHNEGDASRQRQLLRKHNIRSVIGVPVKSRERTIGIIFAGTEHPIAGLSTHETRLLEALGCQIGTAIDRTQQYEKMMRLSQVDELTGLYNRRYLEEALDNEIYRSQRSGRPFCLVMMDLDGFKAYNDKLGHQSGDHVLQALARALKEGLRKTDVACRYGGDEFCIVVPSTEAQKAEVLMNHIRSAFLDMSEVQHTPLESPLGLSAGIAQYPQAAVTAQALTFIADSALYTAKKNCRNRSIIVSDLDMSIVYQSSASPRQIYALVDEIESREPCTRGHADKVAIVSEMIGRAIGLSAEELSVLQAAALLHDVGKASVPRSILVKPGKLAGEQWRVMKSHSLEGARIVTRARELIQLAPIIKHHHERYNGTGYPAGLSADKIPIECRIISIADAYDAMTNNRVYSKGISSRKAIAEIRKCSGTLFDPQLVEVFLENINDLPQGKISTDCARLGNDCPILGNCLSETFQAR